MNFTKKTIQKSTPKIFVYLEFFWIGFLLIVYYLSKKILDIFLIGLYLMINAFKADYLDSKKYDNNTRDQKILHNLKQILNRPLISRFDIENSQASMSYRQLVSIKIQSILQSSKGLDLLYKNLIADGSIARSDLQKIVKYKQQKKSLDLNQQNDLIDIFCELQNGSRILSKTLDNLK